MKTKEFRATLELIGSMKRQNYIEKLFQPSLKTNLPNFLANASVSVKPATFLTHFVTQKSSNEIISYLYDHRRKQQKYSEY